MFTLNGYINVHGSVDNSPSGSSPHVHQLMSGQRNVLCAHNGILLCHKKGVRHSHMRQHDEP